MLARWLRLWFGFREPVDRRTYFMHGLGLMLFKYALDAFLIWRSTGRLWTPLDYFNPLWSARAELFRNGPPGSLPPSCSSPCRSCGSVSA